MRKISALILVAAAGGVVLFADSRSLLKEGDRAPDFVAELSTGDTVRLSTYAGRSNVVLFFYPKDFTTGCTTELCSYRDSYSELSSLDAVLFGVNSDPQESHAAFIQRYNLPFPLISDPERKIARQYGAARWGGTALPIRRVTYVIDKQGIVRKVAHHEIAITRHLDDVMEALKRLTVD
jgi:thioredoxin-dependent peroxiredoxin